MKYCIKLSVLFIAFLLQTVLISSVTLWNVIPGVLLLALVSICLFSEMKEAVVYGILIGILLDCTSGRIPGMYTLICMYTGIFCAFLNSRTNRDNIWLVLFYGFFITFLYETAIAMFTLVRFEEIPLSYGMKNVALPSAFIHTLLIVPIYYGVKKLLTKWGWVGGRG